MSFLDGVGRLRGVSSLPASAAATRNSSKPAADKGTTEAPQATDAATISTSSTLTAKALGESDVRTEKVEALRSSIADGSYAVSSTDVASKIVDTMLYETRS